MSHQEILSDYPELTAETFAHASRMLQTVNAVC